MTEAEARAAGFELADYDTDDPTEIWPENVDAVGLFISVQSQWRMGGMGRPTGLDYPAVFATLDRLHRSDTPERRDEIFADVQVMESAALKEMAKK